MRKRQMYLVITICAAFLVGVNMTVISSHAAGWHSGTPYALRGHWRTKTIHQKGNMKTTSKAAIGANKIEFNYFGSMPDIFAHIKWHKFSQQVYILKARRFLDSYQKVYQITIKRPAKNKMWVYLDGDAYPYPGSSTTRLFHRTSR
ncbi:hypothetical protein [Lentilactobacillus hilgardii]|uniref:hypothetical protein n=1 Tax=Lentilactobacillus hilgardii TaxID=1588 RepID=UPI0021A67610|nr:hypothetical protein [Lentilactobacillus hilgardii]MCT3398881.1 hypothetical protein [Lentilactobacillus hilgardii]